MKHSIYDLWVVTYKMGPFSEPNLCDNVVYDSEEEAESALEEIDKEDLEMKKKNPTYPDIKNKVCTISDWVRSIKEYHLQQGYK